MGAGRLNTICTAAGVHCDSSTACRLCRLEPFQKHTLKFLADIYDANTLFLCFCETFVHDGIGDFEIQIPEFTIVPDVILCLGLGVVFVFTLKHLLTLLHVSTTQILCASY